MLKDTKYCNCSISSNKLILKSNINHSFCNKCGSILIKTSNNNIYYTLKQKQKQKETEFNPIDIIKSMKKKTEEEYPYLNNEYNMSDLEKYNKEKIVQSINIYSKHRKNIILTLQKMMKMLDYSDLIFYQCLFYIDIYLSHNMSEEFSEKKILYYLVGYFLCSVKSKETDIYEPSLDSFCCLKKKIYLSVDKIAYYEVICLQSIKYNIFSYSAYDWMTELITIGVVFDCEINKSNSIILINGHRHSIINTISKCAMKMLLNITVKNIFIKYSPMYISFSLIQIAREKYLDKKCLNSKLFYDLVGLYGINHKDYKNCYKELKSEMQEKLFESNDILAIDKNENSDTKDDKEILDIGKNKKIVNDDINAANTYCKIDKNVVVTNKLKSSMAVIRVSDNLIKKEESRYDNIDNNIEDGNDKRNDNNEDNNIIIYDENNNDDEEEKKLCLNNDVTISSSDNKIRSSLDLVHIKTKNKNKLYIDCNNNAYRSNDNLPKVELLFDKSLNSSNYSKETDQGKNTPKNIKYSSSKQVAANSFLRTNQKALNPIKNKNALKTNDNKRYFQSNFNNSNGLNPKEELDTMRRSLFCDTSNSNKKLTSKDAVSIFSRKYNKMKSSNLMPVISSLHNMIKDDVLYNNNIEEDKNFQDNENNIAKIRNRCKSKGTTKNNLSGKETKTHVPKKRNQSINNNKKKTLKTLDSSNSINTNANIKRKNK